jgi:replicative DNA helicase
VAEWAGIRTEATTVSSKPKAKTTTTLSAKRVELPQTYEEGRKKERRYLEECNQRLRLMVEEPEKAPIKGEGLDPIAYLKGRGIEPAAAARYGWGWNPSTKRIVIPWIGCDYYHIDRAINEAVKPKYTKPARDLVGAQPIFNAAAAECPAVVLVEGALDAWCALMAMNEGGGSPMPVIATGGTGSRDVLNYLAKLNYKGVVVPGFDNDEPKADGTRAGEDAEKKLREQARELGLKVATQHVDYGTDPKEVKDLGDVFAKKGAGAVAMLITNAINAAAAEQEQLEEQRLREDEKALGIVDCDEALRKFFNIEERPIVYETGFERLDKAMNGGIRAGQVHTLGALSSLGKTTFLVQIANNIAAAGHPVLFVTIEESATMLMAKSLARLQFAISKEPVSVFDIGDPKFRQRLALEDPRYRALFDAYDQYRAEIMPNMFYRQEVAQPTVFDVQEAALALKRRTGQMPVVFIDYLQLLKEPDQYTTDKRAVDVNMMQLRQFAATTGAAIVTVSSINRSSYTSGVEFESFKESGAVEYGSDVVIGLQIPKEIITAAHDAATTENAGKAAVREGVKAIKEQEERPMELVILKNRNGRVPRKGIKYKFNAPACAFEEMPDGYHWEEEIEAVKAEVEEFAKRK